MSSGQASPFGELVKRIRTARGYSTASVGQRGGFSDSYLTMIERGTRGGRTSRDMVLRIAKGLRATDDERDELLRLAGHSLAGELPPAPGFVDAVNADTALRADQKRVLIDLYVSMVR